MNKKVTKQTKQTTKGGKNLTSHIPHLTSQKGITLIALIITIIVMLILVAVTVTTVINSGLFGKAGEAAERWKGEQEKEIALGQNLADIVNQYTNGAGSTGGNGGGTTPTIPPEATPGERVTANAEYTSNGKTATIPAGFTLSGLANEQTIDGGLVIYDIPEGETVDWEDEDAVLEAQKTYDQFVWVPCNTTGSDGLIQYAQDKQYNDGTTASKQWWYINNQDDTSIKYTDWTDNGGNSESVDKYGGFYVGRYEAGIPEEADFYANTAGATYYTNSTTPSKNVTTYNPISRKGALSWNYISQENAKVVSENMYKDSTSVESRLIDSYAWDTIVNWMESKQTGIALDSTKYGNYYNAHITINDTLYAEHNYINNSWTVASTYTSGTISTPNGSGTARIELPTGIIEQTKVLNIYDMVGNMWEWTTEIGYRNAGETGTKYAVHRGGSLLNYGNEHTLPGRFGGNTAKATWVYLGFRVILYVK